MSQQVVKLKRTAVEGKVPSTSNIELGELAINTFDGRIFFEKDNGTPSIQQVVTTNSQTTGSLNILGDVTASFFVGDGSQITNLPTPEISQVATVTASFQEVSSISVNHNFDSRNIIVSVYDSSYSQLIPTSVVLTDNDNVDITLSGPHSGFAVVAKGGHIVSGTLVQEVTEVSTVTASFDNQSTIVVTHSFESKNVIISVYDSNDSQLIPQSVTLTDLNTATILLSGNHSGFVVVAKGGHLVSGSATTSYTNLTNIPSGIVSGSSQLTSSLDLRYALSGSVGEGGGTSDFTQLTNVPSGLVSGSSQIVSILDSLNTYTASQSTSSLATTGSNTFVGTQTFSGSIIPATDNTYDLGSPTKQFRDLYLSSASLYIDGTKVLGSTAQELTITTDAGQSIKILEAGTDNIILQSADGDIQLKSSGGGNLLFDPTTGLIDIRGTLQIQDGNKITSSGGNSIQFGNNIGITGSLSTSGDINGINLTSFSSSLSTQINSIQSSTSSTEERWTMFFEYTSSNDTTNTTQNSRLTSLETKSGSVDSSISNINSFTSSNGNTSLNDYTSSLKSAVSIDGQNVTVNGNFTVSGTQTTVNSTTVQIGDNIIELNGSGAANGGLLVKDATAPNTVSGSLLWDSTNDYWKGGALGSESKLLVAGGDNVVSGSSQVVGILSSLNTYTGSNDTTNNTQNSRLTSIESTTGSYETKGRGIVSGSSQITISSTTGYGSVLNQSVLTTSSPTFGGLTLNGSLSGTSGTFSGNIITTGGTLGVGATPSSNYGIDVLTGTTAVIQARASTAGNGDGTTTAVVTRAVNSGANDWAIARHNAHSHTWYGGSGAGTLLLTLSSAGAGTFASSVTATSILATTWVGAQGTRISSSPSVQGVYLGNSGTTSGDFATIEMVGGTAGGSEIDFTVPNTDRRGRVGYDNTSNYMWFETNDGTEKVRITSTGTLQPAANGTQDLGTSSLRWSTVYTSDLSLSNGIGDYTIVEGEDDLFIYNNKKGKVYKFALIEVDPNVATPKKS